MTRVGSPSSTWIWHAPSTPSTPSARSRSEPSARRTPRQGSTDGQVPQREPPIEVGLHHQVVGHQALQLELLFDVPLLGSGGHEGVEGAPLEQVDQDRKSVVEGKSVDIGG